ncbi:uncharacterized protein [Diabrotica undecimpunctata]|uniref:uncharacterized protein n=1 Tax=Diabrotica undecimpunctata TaxID=50387 RepID=UPI003B63BCD1
MESYVNQVIETAQKLNRTGFKIDDTWVGSLLLAGLPERYMPMILAIEHSGIGITTDEIKSKLLDMQIDGASSGKQKAFATKSSEVSTNHVKNVNKKDKRNITCFRCKQKGHFMNKCPNANNNAFSAVFLSRKFKSTDFYIDSGCSTHLTARKDWLRNIRDGSMSNISVANSELLTVECAGDMMITTIVDNKRSESRPQSEIMKS